MSARLRAQIEGPIGGDVYVPNVDKESHLVTTIRELALEVIGNGIRHLQ